MDNTPILYAEDDENDVFFMRLAMRRAPLTNPLHVVTCGQSAIEYLAGEGEYADRTRFPLPGLMLLDLKMPRRNGFEVLEWMRNQAHLDCVVVIVLTSSSQPSDVQLAHHLRANAFVVKPANAESLTDMLRAIKAFWFTFHTFSSLCSDPRERLLQLD